MKKISFTTGLLRRFFLSILLVNAISMFLSLFVQNYFIDYVYFITNLPTVVKEVDRIKEKVNKLPIKEIAKHNTALSFSHRTESSLVMIDDQQDIVDETILRFFYHALIAVEDGSYRRVLLDFIYDDPKLNDLSNPLQVGQTIRITGSSINGTQFINPERIITENATYLNPKAQESDTTLTGSIIEFSYSKQENGNLKHDLTKLWNMTQEYIGDMNKFNKLKESALNDKTFQFYDRDIGTNLYFKTTSTVDVDGKNVYFLILYNYSNVSNTFKVLNDYFLLWHSLVFILLTLLTYIFIKKITKPILTLNKYAKRIAKEDFNYRIKVHTKDELEQLCDSLHDISNNLSNRIHNLHEVAEKKSEDERHIRQLLANLSHEFKTPLAIISGFIQMLQDNINPHDKQHQLQIMDEEVTRLNELVMETLQLTKYESKEVILDTKIFTLKETVLNMVSRFTKVLQDKNINLELDLASNQVLGDQRKIEQAIMNILSNSLRHATPNTQLKIFNSATENQLFLHVMNHGPRIPEDELQKIWDSYYRIEKGRHRSTGGTGLGLPIVKKIFLLHHSKFSLRNHDHGTEYYFSLQIVNKKET